MKRGVLVFCIAALLILAACKGAECKKDVDCKAKPATAYSAKCLDKKCVYTPIPNQCSNGICEASENKCTCQADCGPCTGQAPGSKYLVQQCVQNNCLQDVPQAQIKPIYSSADQTNAGDKFKIDTIYNQPFNLKKDMFDVSITLSLQAPQNRDEHILAAELTATTKDGRTITLTRQTVDKYLWTTGSTISEELILDFPTAEIEGELSNLALKIDYEYAIVQAGKKTQRQGQLQNRYKDKMIFVKPSGNYPCPPSCDDKNPGTRDFCGVQTGFFCKHEPILGACGNFKCDGSETKCSCPQDCGLCSGSAGNFLDYTCIGSTCSTMLKAGTTIQPKTIFDDRSLGPVQLNNNYKFVNPFNIKTDKFELDFKIYHQDPTVSGFTIETVRLLEGTQQLAETVVDKELSETETTPATITIANIVQPEEEHQITLAVWYHFDQSGQQKSGKFEKQFEKITLINPG